MTTGNRNFAIQLLKQMQRQALHAEQIVFIHPTTNKEMTFSAPVPVDFEEILEVLRKEKTNEKGKLQI